MATTKYTRAWLLAAHSTVTGTRNHVAAPVFKRLNDLDLCARKSTKRGFRANHPRAIPIIAERRAPVNAPADRRRDQNNNIAIKRTPSWKLGSFINLGLINAQSVGNKSTLLCEYIMECAFDVAAITETWLRDGDDPVILNLRPPGFNFTGQNRPIAKSKGRGGGLALLIRDSIPYERLEMRAFETFESLSVRLKKTSACIALLYRPPPSPENGYTVNGFFSEFEEYVSSLLVAVPGNLYLMGDFNFHLENPADARSNRFSSLLTSFGLRQHVHSPTHRDGGVFDLAMTAMNALFQPSVFIKQDHRSTTSSHAVFNSSPQDHRHERSRPDHFAASTPHCSQTSSDSHFLSHPLLKP
jgi:hypothetical protein